MDDKQKDGGGAFPEVYSTDGTCIDSTKGLSKLEWFAGMALMGISTNTTYLMVPIREQVRDAFTYAQAMIEEAEKRRRG